MRFTERTTRVVVSPIAMAHAVLAERSGKAPLLDLSQAAPAYPPSPTVVAALADATQSPETSRYAPSPGLPELRSEVANDLNTVFGADIGPENVLVTAGCNQAFCVVSSALAAPDDDIIITVPYYFNHDMWLKLDGVHPTYLYTDETGIPDVAEARSLIGPRTRAIVLVTPGNPTGAICPPATIEAFYDLAEAAGIALIVDETYRTFTGSSEPTHRLYTRPNWADTLVTLHSFSKDLAIPGYRVGAVVASPAMLNESLKISDCVAICAPRIGQVAAMAGLRDDSGWRAKQAQRIAHKLEVFRSVMAEEPGGYRLASSGAFFGWVKRPHGDATTEEVVRRLVIESDVLVIPGTAFTPTDEGWLRFSFANLSDSELIELGQRLSN